MPMSNTYDYDEFRQVNDRYAGMPTFLPNPDLNSSLMTDATTNRKNQSAVKMINVFLKSVR